MNTTTNHGRETMDAKITYDLNDGGWWVVYNGSRRYFATSARLERWLAVMDF